MTNDELMDFVNEIDFDVQKHKHLFFELFKILDSGYNREMFTRMNEDETLEWFCRSLYQYSLIIEEIQPKTRKNILFQRSTELDSKDFTEVNYIYCLGRGYPEGHSSILAMYDTYDEHKEYDYVIYIMGKNNTFEINYLANTKCTIAIIYND